MKEKIWRYLISAGMTKAGAAGMMGNLQAESGLIPNRVEELCLKRLAEVGKYYTHATYTAFVDDGTISMSEFMNPLPGAQYGYGLAQWTTPSRKAGLYTLAKAKKASIGDLSVQLEWLISELKMEYKDVWKTLTTTDDLMTASNAVLMHFEMPADQSVSVQGARYGLCKDIYNEFAEEQKMATAKTIINIMRGWIGFSEYNGKYREIIDIYNRYGEQHGYPRGYRVPYGVAWCDVTVSAAFIEANAVNLIGGVECGVEEHIKIFKQKGIWIEDGKIAPEAGYIICYNWDDGIQPNDGYADHIGVVESVVGNTITVIEGNYNNAVQRRNIPVGWGYIRGYAAPRYTGNEVQKPSEQEKPSTGGGINKEPKWVGKVTADMLNVRSWAGTEYPNIKSWPTLKEGNLVDICDTVKAIDGSDWYYVRIAGKYYGFVSSKYIERV